MRPLGDSKGPGRSPTTVQDGDVCTDPPGRNASFDAALNPMESLRPPGQPATRLPWLSGLGRGTTALNSADHATNSCLTSGFGPREVGGEEGGGALSALHVLGTPATL